MKSQEKGGTKAGIPARLKDSDPEVQEYVRALKAENLGLQKEIVDLQARQVTLENRIRALEELKQVHSKNEECQDI